MTSFERLTARLGLALVLALLPSPLLLLVPSTTDKAALIATSTLHLSASMLFALGVTLWAVLPAFRAWPNEGWFARLPEPLRLLAAAAVHIAAVAGVTLLVVLAWGAALRFAPSLQYLQIISALDIVWGLVAIVALGPVVVRSARSLWLGGAAGVAFIAYCQWPLVRYLANVGFTDDGGWKVDGAAMWRYILPYDMMAAALALAIASAAAWMVWNRERGATGQERAGLEPDQPIPTSR